MLIHYAFGGVRAQALSVFVLSTSTTGSSRRVPPPRGSRLAVPFSSELPFSVFLSFLYGTRLLLFPRVAADGSGWDSSSLRPDVRHLRRAHPCAGSTSTGAFGRVSRARLNTSSSFFSCCPKCSSGCSARFMSSGAVGRVSRTRLCTSAHPSWSSPLLSAGIASSCSRSAWQALFTGWQGQDRLFQCSGTGNQRLFGDCQL